MNGAGKASAAGNYGGGESRAAGWFRSLRVSLFPPPRRPVTWRSAMPLIIYLAAFILICLWLDLTDTVLFTRLWPFWLLLLAPWLWWLHQAGYAGLSRGRALASVIARFLLLSLFIILLTEPRAVRKDQTMSVVFVVDVSASVREETWRDQGIAYVLEMVSDKPNEDLAGLVFFGRDAAVELPPQEVFPYDNLRDPNVQVRKDATNIAEALRVAAAMLPQDKNGRIVLISDGVHTEGNLLDTLDDLKSKDIAVDVRPLVYAYDDEVWLERLELPRSVKVGETYEATVILSSLKDGQGKLRLFEDGQPVTTTVIEDGQAVEQEAIDVAFKAGKNRYTIKLPRRQAGYYEYKATIEAEKDTKTENNNAISHLYLRGKGKVLIVFDPNAPDARDYTDFVDALQQAEREVELKSAYEFPRDALALLPYDCVVFANAPASAFDPQQLEAVHDAVHGQGTGFIMLGGANSYGPGGYHRTAVEQALPVSMDLSQKKVLPKGALVIVLHTCEFPQGNTWAKNITKQAIKVLNDRDDVGVLAQDWQGTDQWVFPLTPAGQYEQLAQKINNAQIGDMMSFVPTMQMALTGLQNSDASVKHMIIISDGDPTMPPGNLLQQFAAAQIKITTVTVFPHGGVNGPEVQLMKSIANVTGGNHYLPQNPKQLPEIFIKEATTLRRSAIQNKTFTPEFGIDPFNVLKDINALPKLHGYVLTTPKLDVKANASVVLEGPELEDTDPVLAYWQYGLGKTAAWTSDLSRNWAKDWVGWDKYQAFVKQLVTAISGTFNDGALRMRSFAAGGDGIIIVDDFNEDGGTFLELLAEVDLPNGQSQTVPLRQVGSNRYEGRFPLIGEGRYRISAVGVAADRQPERTFGGFVVPYSQEYLRFSADPITLQRIAQRTGGEQLDGSETGRELYTRERDVKKSSAPIVDRLLLLLACLIPLDVGLRRVQIDVATIRGWLSMGRREQPSDEMFTTLLKRKQDVSTTLSRKTETAPAQGEALDLDAIKDAQQKKAAAARVQTLSQQAAEKESQQDRPQSMTERLLAAKRRAQQEKEKEKE